jgi:enoyl-CoA hydratase
MADESPEALSVVLLDVSERIATVTLNRPEARNALSSDVLRLLPQRLRDADADPEVDVIVLTGADPAFCAGLDLKELGSTAGNLGGSGADGAPNTDGIRGPFPRLSKPLIGAINGAAITGGFELALNCDFLVASERAKFGDTHSRVGVMPGWGLTVLLPQAIGVRRAREMSFTGNFLSAEDAFQWGLVNHVVPHEELLPTVRKLAADIIGNDQPGVRQIRRTYAEIHTDAEGWVVEARDGRAWQREMFSPDQVAARRAAIQARGRQQETVADRPPA